MKKFFTIELLVPTSVFVLAFFFVPITLLNILSDVPGNIGDARLNNYFLENIYNFLIGQSNSLWHLSFFYPFPYIVGFSDNLFGSAIIYVIARIVSFETDTSFQIWFLFGYVANFAAAYYALRRMNGSVLAATVGAVIFAFALPTTAHAGHAQLHYRFGLPLAIVLFADFINSKNWKYFLIASAWLVWQFYAGVYVGFFTLLLLVTITLAYLGHSLIGANKSLKGIVEELLVGWRAQSGKQKRTVVVGLAFLVLLLLLLFYPYLQVSHLYGGKRSWGEISSMLPRLQSYFLADASYLWSSPSAQVFNNIPMRHEHQMFFGFVPITLAIVGLLLGSREKNGVTFTLMTGMFGIALILTLYVGGFSLWYLIHKLPLASAIRAMTRLDQAFLFPLAYLSSIAIDEIKKRLIWGVKLIAILILPLLIMEAGLTKMDASSKDSWRQRIMLLNNSVPNNVPENSILFFAQRSGPPFADELDAMWVSLKHRTATINGYSGLFPPGYDYVFGTDCAAIPRRIISYLKFSNQSDNIDLYRNLMGRIIPIGFNNCDSLWLKVAPAISSSNRIYTPSDFGKLKYGVAEIKIIENNKTIFLDIVNSSSYPIPAISTIGNPIRISWRYIDSNGSPLSGWDARKDLPFDIPPQGSLKISIPLDNYKKGTAKAVQVSFVQEGVFWAHDVGLKPLTIPLE